jgi:hypothetical protein
MPSVPQSSGPTAPSLDVGGRGRVDDCSDEVITFLVAKLEQFSDARSRLFCLFGSPQLNVKLEHGREIVVEREPAS